MSFLEPCMHAIIATVYALEGIKVATDGEGANNELVRDEKICVICSTAVCAPSNVLAVEGVKMVLGEDTVNKMLRTVSGEASSAKPFRWWMHKD